MPTQEEIYTKVSATLVEALMGNGYRQRQELRRFQLVRQVPLPTAAARSTSSSIF